MLTINKDQLESLIIPILKALPNMLYTIGFFGIIIITTNAIHKRRKDIYVLFRRATRLGILFIKRIFNILRGK